MSSAFTEVPLTPLIDVAASYDIGASVKSFIMSKVTLLNSHIMRRIKTYGLNATAFYTYGGR
jgi:hypothetical protein